MYESYFGLNGKPFQLNPDPRFFFASKGHKRALAYLEYGLHQGEGFIVITGEVGAGKTTLLRGLIDRLPQDAIVATQIVSTQVGADDLLRLVAEGFGLPVDAPDKATLLTAIRHHCLRQHELGKRALLIVDEAQNLPPGAVEELRMLSNFQIGTRSLVQSFLVGQPELRTMMQLPQMSQLKQRIIASYHLGPLDGSETESYIQHRLRHVDWSNDPAFEAAAFARIHQLSGGIPRRINSLCDRLLLTCYLAGEHTVTAAAVDDVAEEVCRELESDSTAKDTVGSSPAHRVNASANLPPESLTGGSFRFSSPMRRAQVANVPGEQSLSDQARLEDMEDRIAALESNLHRLQTHLRRVLRQVERQEALPFNAARRGNGSSPAGLAPRNAPPIPPAPAAHAPAKHAPIGAAELDS